MGILVDDPGIIQKICITLLVALAVCVVCAVGGGLVLVLVWLLKDSISSTNADFRSAKAELPNASGQSRLAAQKQTRVAAEKAASAQKRAALVGGIASLSTGGVL